MEIDALKEKYDIIAAGLSASPGSDFQFIGMSPVKPVDFHLRYPVLIRKFISIILRIAYLNKNGHELKNSANFKKLKNVPYDLVIVHHFTELKLATKLAKYRNVKLIFNAHEYYPLEFDSNELWMQTVHLQYMAIAKEYLPKVDRCFCVAGIIAEKYAKEFGLKCEVITNAKKYYELEPKQLSEGRKIRLVHHGNAMRSRNLELMIDATKKLGSNYTLDLILVPSDTDYIAELKNKYVNDPQIIFREPVAVDEIPNMLNSYDIGIYILPPKNYNDRFALPNKFFEFVQGRLMLAISPSPEMAAIVEQYKLGVVADDFTSETLAKKIRSLSAEEINNFKRNSHTCAQNLNVEHNEKLILKVVQELIK